MIYPCTFTHVFFLCCHYAPLCYSALPIELREIYAPANHEQQNEYALPDTGIAIYDLFDRIVTMVEKRF